MLIRSRVRVPKQQYGSDCRLLPLFRLVVASCVVLAYSTQPTGLAQPIQQPTGIPTVDATPTLKARIEQFKNEKVFWKQIEIAKAIAGTHDAKVLPPLVDWLAHRDRHIRGNVAFIFASLGDPRGLHTIADILTDRSERPEGQGIASAPSDGRYRFERQVAADRYYAAHLLGDLKDPRGIALLVPLLDDPETRSIVPWSLAEIGDHRAVGPLMAQTDQDDPSVRVLAIYALETLKAREALSRLQQLLEDDRRSNFGERTTVAEAARRAIAVISQLP